MTVELGFTDSGCQPQPFAPLPRLVLFDLDDTLGDYAAARASRLRRAFMPHLLRAEASEIEATLVRMIAESIEVSPHGADHFSTLFARFGINAPEAASAAALWYTSNRFYDLRLFHDAVSTLKAVRFMRSSTGAPERRRLGIVTNGPPDVQREKVAFLGLAELVDFVIISGEFGVEKPDPRIYAEALRLGGACADETVFVGDAPRFDILGANNAGIRSIWVNRTSERWADRDHRPTCEVADLTSVIPLLGSPVDRA